MLKKSKIKEHFLTLYGDVLEEEPNIIKEPILIAPCFLNEISELKIINYLIKIIERKTIFVDVGSHIGFYAIPLAYHFKKVIAYEPSKFQYDFLKRNIKINKLENITIKNCAVGSEKSKTTLYVMGRSGGGNTIAADVAAMGDPMESYKVNVVALDDEKFEGLDVLKIDVEGFELEVLKGSYETINKFKPLIICEVWDTGNRRVEVINYFNTLNYAVNFPFENFPEIALCRHQNEKLKSLLY